MAPKRADQVIEELYPSIMQEVIQASLVDFEDAGTSLTILDDLKSLWEQHLTSAGVAHFPWDAPLPPVKPEPLDDDPTPSLSTPFSLEEFQKRALIPPQVPQRVPPQPYAPSRDTRNIFGPAPQPQVRRTQPPPNTPLVHIMSGLSPLQRYQIQLGQPTHNLEVARQRAQVHVQQVQQGRVLGLPAGMAQTMFRAGEGQGRDGVNMSLSGPSSQGAFGLLNPTTPQVVAGARARPALYPTEPQKLRSQGAFDLLNSVAPKVVASAGARLGPPYPYPAAEAQKPGSQGTFGIPNLAAAPQVVGGAGARMAPSYPYSATETQKPAAPQVVAGAGTRMASSYPYPAMEPQKPRGPQQLDGPGEELGLSAGEPEPEGCVAPAGREVLGLGAGEPEPKQDEALAGGVVLVDETELGDDDDETVSSGEGEEFEDVPELMVCLYDKVSRARNKKTHKWKCALRDGVLVVGGKEYVFTKASAELAW